MSSLGDLRRRVDVPCAREMKRRLLVDRRVAVCAGVDPRRAGQHRARHAVASAGLEDVGGTGDVHLDGSHGMGQRIAGVGYPGEMEHHIEITGRLHHRREIQHIDGPVRDIPPLRRTNVEHDHVRAGSDHPIRHARPDEPRAPGDPDSSRRLPHRAPGRWFLAEPEVTRVQIRFRRRVVHGSGS